jgi:predicted ATPase/DNA-binding SARP family transcriptional activator
MELLWPESTPDAARHNLRTALSSLRRQLEPPGFVPGSVLCADRNGIELNQRAVTTDIADFEAALEQARDGDGETALLRAVELYRGRLLDGCYDDWIMPLQHHFEELYFEALRELLTHLEQRREYSRALSFAQRGASFDPLREDVQRDLMRLYALAGQPQHALRQYHELEGALRHQLQEEPESATQSLAAQIAKAQPGRASETATTQRTQTTQRKAPRATPTKSLTEDAALSEPAAPGAAHWPLQLTRFFGRDAEIAQLQTLLLNSETRLITLLGMGGGGKTRLAQEAVRRLPQQTQRFPGGVYFVALADLADGALLAGAVLDALGKQASPHLDPLDEAVKTLSRSATLLLFDAFEHLVESGAAPLQRLLQRAPQLCCLVTSRQRLQLAGERIFPVPPLALPPDDVASPADVASCAGVALFVDRAQSVRPDFQVTRANAKAVAQLCRQLEGSPLAIELAAARSGVLSPAQMLNEIERRFDFLVSRQRGVAARHRSLQAVIASSYDALDADAQRFFAQLSVFRGGCTLQAARQICREPRALELLETLREYSLLQLEEHDGATRFRLLDSLREYGAERLEPHENDTLQERHAAYFTALAREAAAAMPQPRSVAGRTHLLAEQDNLRAALEWSLTRKSEYVAPLASALVEFWERRSQLVEARRWLSRAREQAKKPLWRARLLCGEGRIALMQGDVPSSQALLKKALALFRALGEMESVAETLNLLALVALQTNRFGRATAYVAAALQIWESALPPGGDARAAPALVLARQRGHAASLSLRGALLISQRDLARGIPMMEEAVHLFRLLQDDCGLANALDLLGQSLIVTEDGDVERGRALVDEGLALFRGAGEKMWICRTLWGRANLALSEGDATLARSLYDEAIGIALAGDNRLAMPYLLEGLAGLEIFQSEAARAARLLGAARSMRAATGLRQVPFWIDNYQKIVAATRAALGETVCERECAAGETLGWERAAAYALENAPREPS